MKKLPALLVVTAVALPAAAADYKAVAAQACHDAGYDAGAIEHFMALIKTERESSGGVNMDLVHSWGEQVKCYAARLDKVAASFKQQTGRKFVAEKVCATGPPHQAYANGLAEGATPGPTCTP